MKRLLTTAFKGLMIITFFLCMSNNSYSQTKFTGAIYIMSSDKFVPIKYTRSYSGSGNEFITKYTIFHPQKGNAWMTVTATHNKSNKSVEISVDDTKGSIFSQIHDEKTTYETPSLEPFGFRGTLGALNGKRTPNQLMVKFASNKYENVKVVHVWGSDVHDFENTYFFVLDEKN